MKDTKLVLIASIRRDSGAQFRDALSLQHVSNLTDAILEGATLPPIDLFFDGTTYWLGDGDHRIEAHLTAKRDSIEARIFEGNQLAAKRHGRGANATHGLPRSNKAKRAAVLDALQDPEWKDWSDRAIAKECKVSHPMVAQIREEMEVTGNISSDERLFRDKHGNISKMKIGKIGNVSKKTKFDLIAVEKEIDALPLGQALAQYGHRGKIFRDNALLFFQFQNDIEGFRELIDSDFEFPVMGTGPISDGFLKLGQISHPSLWRGCAACKGSLRVGERRDPCHACDACGFTINPGEGISPDEVQAYSASFNK